MEYKTRNEVPNEFKWDLSKMYNDSKEIDRGIILLGPIEDIAVFKMIQGNTK